MSATLVPNEVLAFLQYQLDVMDEVSIEQICTSNFTEEEIRDAKSLLFSALNMADRMPSRRRDEKGERSLRDIIKVFKETDPDDVPTFVAKDLRKLPPVTFDHVDVTRLLKDITSLRTALKEMEFKFGASQSTINDLRNEVVALRDSISLCRSTEVSYVNTRRGAQRETFESANLTTPPAVDRVTPRPARPAPPPESPPRVANLTPAGYAAAAAKPPVKRQEITRDGDPVKHRDSPRRAAHLSSVNSHPLDEEGFTKVEKRKKKKKPSSNKCGTAPTGNNHLLRPAIPTTQLYVSRLHHSTQASDVVEYVRVKTKFIVRVQRLEPRNNLNFNSFVVRVPSEQLSIFMSEEFWPRGVVFRRFRGRLRNIQPKPIQRNMTLPVP
ncbi:uncharacterized protein LOC123693195 [Colias croceus]|uniref:uncharacterized protein LOC123693195 n=1 Tax=Colias crocea TaxID=72248 RepID=UPI001E27A4B7|nr:uncharacterized protein LOC123693195 [Colias croceus]